MFIYSVQYIAIDNINFKTELKSQKYLIDFLYFFKGFISFCDYKFHNIVQLCKGRNSY